MKTQLPLTPEEQKLQQELSTMTLSGIALKIKREWKPPYFGAVPYIDAMSCLETIEDNYMADSGKSIVIYFLSNANTFRGTNARLIKAELKKRAGIK